MSAAARVSAIIAREGEPVKLTLNDPFSSPPAAVTLDTYAKRYEATGSDLDGDLQQRTMHFRMGNMGLANHSPPLRLPRKFDVIESADGERYVVQTVDTRRRGATPLMHIMTVKGDA